MVAKYCCYRKNLEEVHRIIKPSSRKTYMAWLKHANEIKPVITSECGTGVEKLSKIVGKYFFPGVFITESRI